MTILSHSAVSTGHLSGYTVEFKGYEWCKPNDGMVYHNEVSVITDRGRLILCRVEAHYIADGSVQVKYVPVKHNELNTVT